LWEKIPYMGNVSDEARPDDQGIDTRLAARLAGLRQEAGWSLEELAERSGISRASLSRMERGETSPTAAVLGRLCTAYGRTMSRLLSEIEADPAQLVRDRDQLVWVDPETGFRRRSVSPPAHGYRGEMMAGELPAGAVIAYDAPSIGGLEQHVWMLGGVLALTVEGVTHLLAQGDCLRFRLFGPTRFACPGPEAARYVIALCRP
jgi:transcriptional regulator with XRE-family HTH domain